MAMLDPANRESDRRAGQYALYVIVGLSVLLVILIGFVVVYAMGYHY